MIIGELLHCRPLHLNWDASAWNSKHCFDIKPLYSTVVAVGLGVDILTWTTPHYVVWGLQLRRAHKLAITAIFAIGILSATMFVVLLRHVLTTHRTIIIGAIRIANIATFAPGGDLTYGLGIHLMSNLTQMSVGIIVACMPHMRPVFEKIVPRRFTRISVPSSIRTSLSGKKVRTSRHNSISVTTTIKLHDSIPCAVFPTPFHDGHQDWCAPMFSAAQIPVVPQQDQFLHSRAEPPRAVGCCCLRTRDPL